MKIPIGIVDDHQLFLKSLALMLESFNNYSVVLMAINGKDLQEKISKENLPAIMLIDVNMPVMDGIATATWLKKNYPSIKLVALSMNDTDKTIIAMLKAGCCSYLLKDTHPDAFEKALYEIYLKGFHNADASNINYSMLLRSEKEKISLKEKEKKFLQYACSELSYKEIASLMNVGERTVDGYREILFKKFNVQTRIGLILEAIRRDLVDL
jgi:DNA-binding NarL/FixJ family response regulator